MYERSAIVLERYLNKLFGFDKAINLRENFYNFSDLVEELKEYQTMVTEEEKVINKFEEVAREIQAIQKLQEKLSISNQKLEDERNKLFNAFDENPNTIQNRIEKIEKIVEENNSELKKLREEFIKTYVIFIERQKERNKFARGKRSSEEKYISTMKDANEKFKNVSVQDVQNMKRFIVGNKEDLKRSIVEIMLRNGKNERIGFNKEVINKAVDIRIEIAEKEAECYVAAYERFKKILSEVESDNIKLEKYEKFLRDNSVKLAFLNAEKEYVIDFLDNERMTVIGGPTAHRKMMEEACKNFDLDINQINNLYELILREIAGKSTKKAYNELYNKTYLRDIQAKERGFEAEVTNIKVNLGTVVNSNYWRIEGIKNIYEVFLQEVTEKFEKDLSDYKVAEIDIIDQIQDFILEKNKLSISSNNKQPRFETIKYDNSNKTDNDYDSFYNDQEDNDNYSGYESDDDYYIEQEDDDDDDYYFSQEDDEDDEYYSDQDEYEEDDDEYDYYDNDYEDEYDDYDEYEYDEQNYDEEYNEIKPRSSTRKNRVKSSNKKGKRNKVKEARRRKESPRRRADTNNNFNMDDNKGFFDKLFKKNDY